jgi:hypothetical protein
MWEALKTAKWVMLDQEKRFYDAVKTKGKLGDYGAYEQRLGTGKSQQPALIKEF